MKIIEAIIIDDEKHARESLNALVDLYCPNVKIIGDAANIIEGQRLIENLEPDLVFLDIAIGEDSGFDLIDILKPINFQLIFTTAHSEFAIQAFRVNALDYLLKPIEPDQLKAAIKKVKRTANSNQLQSQLNHLTRSLSSQSYSQIAISSLEGIIFVEIEKIVHVNGSGNYTTFHLEGGEKIVASKNLGHYESILTDDNFFRCHQSYMVNLRFIKKILTKDGNMIELKDGAQIPLAGKRKETLMSILSGRFRV